MTTTAYISAEIPHPLGFIRSTNLGVCVELSQIRISQISDWNFNSFMHFNKQCVASSEDGLYTLGGDTNNDEEIKSIVEYALTDFDKQHLKRLRKIFITGEFEDDMSITTIGDEGIERVKTVSPITGDNKQEVMEVSCARDIKATHWGLRVQNKNGSDFSLDKIEAILIEMTRRRQKG